MVILRGPIEDLGVLIPQPRFININEPRASVGCKQVSGEEYGVDVAAIVLSAIALAILCANLEYLWPSWVAHDAISVVVVRLIISLLFIWRSAFIRHLRHVGQHFPPMFFQ